jgi:hypothetical protein
VFSPNGWLVVVQVLLQGGDKLTYDEPNPFVGDGNEELAAVAYRCEAVARQAGLFLALSCVLARNLVSMAYPKHRVLPAMSGTMQVSEVQDER